jgi:hypothetical protein
MPSRYSAMPALETVQSRMHKALLVDAECPFDDILGGKASRFQIHKRHFAHSLTSALEKTFPATVNLVDARFFANAADAFIRAHPPKSPCLFEYGAELPGLIDRFPACAELPYLSDVARMEWAIHEIFHADEAAPFRVVSSRWPVDAIWRLAMGRSENPVDMNSGGVRLRIYREGDEAKFKTIFSTPSRTSPDPKGNPDGQK